MRKSAIVALSLLASFAVYGGAALAQNNSAEKIVESAYWKHRTSQFKALPNPTGEICFLGDSITDGCEWRELTGIPTVTNRGISGDTAWGLMARIDEITEGKPSRIFLMIGTNDISWGNKTPLEARDKIAEVLDTIKRDSPSTIIYLESVLPVIDGRVKLCENAKIDALNAELVKLAKAKGAIWVDLSKWFRDENGQLKKSYTQDGLHLTGEAYYQWYSVIRGYLE